MMLYYDELFGEDWCEEPKEEEMALIEAIKENVKQDIKQEMERLRKENAELQQYKKERQEVEKIKNQYQLKLQTEIEMYKRQLRTARLEELFGDRLVIGWAADCKIVLPPKCNKCDSERYIHFKSPSGRDFKEPCECQHVTKKYEPKEMQLVKISESDVYQGERKIDRYYVKSDVGWNGYVDATYRVVCDGKASDEIKPYNAIFLNKETCEKYCEWKTEQEAKKNA